MDSTGEHGGASRRTLLRALAAVPLGLSLPRRAGAAEYGSAAEVLDAIERLAAALDAQLEALGAAVPSARALVASLRADHRRHRDERARLRRRLGLAGPPLAERRPAAAPSLAPLRAAQEALVYAHAEGLPALGDPFAVDRLAHHMVELARHLAIIDLWIQTEEERG